MSSSHNEHDIFCFITFFLSLPGCLLGPDDDKADEYCVTLITTCNTQKEFLSGRMKAPCVLSLGGAEMCLVEFLPFFFLPQQQQDERRPRPAVVVPIGMYAQCDFFAVTLNTVEKAIEQYG